MRASLTRGGVLLAALVALPAAGAIAATAASSGAEREVYAVDLRSGRVALIGLDRHGDVPQIDAPGVVFQDDLYKEKEYTGQTRMKFIPAGAVDHSLAKAGTPLDLEGAI